VARVERDVGIVRLRTAAPRTGAEGRPPAHQLGL